MYTPLQSGKCATASCLTQQCMLLGKYSVATKSWPSSELLASHTHSSQVVTRSAVRKSLTCSEGWQWRAASSCSWEGVTADLREAAVTLRSVRCTEPRCPRLRPHAPGLHYSGTMSPIPMVDLPYSFPSANMSPRHNTSPLPPPTVIPPASLQWCIAHSTLLAGVCWAFNIFKYDKPYLQDYGVKVFWTDWKMNIEKLADLGICGSSL